MEISIRILILENLTLSLQYTISILLWEVRLLTHYIISLCVFYFILTRSIIPFPIFTYQLQQVVILITKSSTLI